TLLSCCQTYRVLPAQRQRDRPSVAASRSPAQGTALLPPCAASAWRKPPTVRALSARGRIAKQSLGHPGATTGSRENQRQSTGCGVHATGGLRWSGQQAGNGQGVLRPHFRLQGGGSASKSPVNRAGARLPASRIACSST